MGHGTYFSASRSGKGTLSFEPMPNLLLLSALTGLRGWAAVDMAMQRAVRQRVTAQAPGRGSGLSGRQ